jgi:hypothetical protein
VLFLYDVVVLSNMWSSTPMEYVSIPLISTKSVSSHGVFTVILFLFRKSLIWLLKIGDAGVFSVVI